MIDKIELLNNKEFYKEMVKTLAINTLANNSNIMYGFHAEKYDLTFRFIKNNLLYEIFSNFFYIYLYI